MFSTPQDLPKAIERLYVKLHETEQMTDHYEAKGWSHMARISRRKAAGIKGAITRYGKLI